MTDDLDGRLRRMLAARADELDPALDGAELRRAAGSRTSGVRRVVAVVGAAAAVLVVALGTQHLGEHPTEHRAPAGNTQRGSTSAPVGPAPVSPAPLSSTPRTSAPRPVLAPVPTRNVRPSPSLSSTAVPTRPSVGLPSVSSTAPTLTPTSSPGLSHPPGGRVGIAPTTGSPTSTAR